MIHGVAGHNPVIPTTVHRLGYEFVRLLQSTKNLERVRIVIGHDTRLSSGLLAPAAITGALAAGGDSYDVGVLPLPAIALLARALDAHGALYVSSGDDTFEYNAVTALAEWGEPLPPEMNARLRAKLDVEDALAYVDGSSIGRNQQYDRAEQYYVDFLRRGFPIDLSGSTIVIDCANGATFRIAPILFRRLGARVAMVGGRPDGTNINLGVGPSSFSQLKQKMAAFPGAVGFSFGADGMRVIALDEHGTPLNGECLLVVIARHLSGLFKELPVPRVVRAAELSDPRLTDLLKSSGIEVVDRFAASRFLSNRFASGVHLPLILAADSTGHVLLPDFSLWPDALLTALAILAAARTSGRSLASLTEDLPADLKGVSAQPAVREQQMTLASRKETEFNLSDPRLFGNDAGEDEDPEVLATHFLRKPTFRHFFDSSVRLAFARGPKGVGKSALLAMVAHDRALAPNAVVVLVRRPDLSEATEPATSEPAVLVNQWQQLLCRRVIIELGAQLRFAAKDVDIAMVEAAELSGYRPRNWLGTVIDRLRGRLGPIQVVKLPISSPVFLLKHFLRSRQGVSVWLVIDDLDPTFLDTQEVRLKVAAFFSACRRMTADFPQLIIRASVRSDVWRLLRQADESLDKLEQYAVDISWSRDETRRILVNKIMSYVRIQSPRSELVERDASSAFNTVFEASLRWGPRSTGMEAALHYLSSARPRWTTQLCRLAGQQAVNRQQNRIGATAVFAAMRAYGRLRLEDLRQEYRNELPDVDRVVHLFQGGQRIYTTQELLDQIEEAYVSYDNALESVAKSGSPSRRSAIDIAQMLYRGEFIVPKADDGLSMDGQTSFGERPELLLNSSRHADGQLWEIHPSFWSVLRINNSIF